MLKFPCILFFIAWTVPTIEDLAEAGKLGPNVKFRNASMIPSEGCLEKCDGVAGQVPDRYAEAFPAAEDALNDWMQQQRAGQEVQEGQAKAKAKATADKPAKAPATPKPAASAPVWKPNTPTGN